ncbi:MAG: asparagine synthase (glutamine-hydrolyzing) [Planctomycetes bacterium]|nr:asparagine synthase (glutamine-hydrolyzing) [Planctomycetota bacterium]
MCGICGFVTTDPTRALTQDMLRSMCDVMAHRGPDDHGIYLDTVVGLGHRRLSIIDVAGGHQPMTNEDRSIWITYNGETYNHLALRARLEATGHRYATRSDTETLIHLYEEDGDDLVHKLRGMCAFAIWDKPRKRLLLVRDRLGIKPLYYAELDGRLLFASEIKSILASGLLEARLNYEALPEFLAFGYNVDYTTLYAGIKKLPPGHRLIWQDGNIKIEQYWDVTYPPEPLKISEEEAVERFTELFDECVEMRLMSDVPLGMFLSGGIDSSAIAAVMAKKCSEPIKTFSVGFAERNYSEFVYARELAESIGADHHEIVIEPNAFFDELPKLIYHEDEPIRWPSSVPLYFVSKLAREHVKVVLTGEGSDELMAGYAKYWAGVQNFRMASTVGKLLPQVLRKLFSRLVWCLPAPMKMRKLLWHSFLCRTNKPEDLHYDNFYGIFNKDLQNEALAPAKRERLALLDPWAPTMAHFNGNGAKSFLDRMLYADVKTYLVELLMKQDQMSMATSIESRVPFLDHELVEFCASLPTCLKLNGKIGKHVLRRAMDGLLPESILTRKKMGFPVPLRVWFADAFNKSARELLTDPGARSSAIFDPQAVHRILDEHMSGRRDWSEQIWLMINTELWLKEFDVNCN